MAVICFDYDGTIADTLSLEEKYYLPALKRHGVTIFRDMADLKFACRENYYSFCARKGIPEETLAAAAAEYHTAIKTNRAAVPLFDGMAELLRSLLKKHRLYVVSHNDAAFIRPRLVEEGIIGFCDIIGKERSKDKCGSLRKIRKDHPDEEVYFISDVSGDMTEAAEARIPHILGVSYGWGTADELWEYGAQDVFDTVEELGAYLEKIE